MYNNSASRFLLSVFAAEGDTLTSSFNQGDIIEFGSYPQSLVTDEALKEELSYYIDDSAWQSLGWYRGTGQAGSMYETDAGKFYDIEYYGDTYRAVKFSEHRAAETSLLPTATYQAALGYTPDNVYYFKFEPIRWRVLDASIGLLLAESILDAPAYSNNAYRTDADEDDTKYLYYYYSDPELTRYSSSWEYSSLRYFLNNTFMETAFSDLESSLLGEVTLTNSVLSGYDEKYSGNNTTDKVFILSTGEISASAYGLNNSLRTKNGSDYAHMHGLFSGVLDAGTGAQYYLRDAISSATVGYVSERGVVSTGVNTYSQDVGVVPTVAVNLELLEQLDLYKDIKVSFSDGVLTLSGTGNIPDRTASITDVLSQYEEITNAVIIKDGITEISENAFSEFISLKTLIIEGETKIKKNAFPDSFLLSTAVLKSDTEIASEAFSPDIFYLNIFSDKNITFSSDIPENINVYKYTFSENTLFVDGSVTMNAYEFFDLLAVLCEDYENVENINFSSFTSTDLVFYTVDGNTGEKTAIPDSTVPEASFSVEASVNGESIKISFNTLCEMASDGTLEEFYLITKSEVIEDIEDTDMEINSLSDLITYAIKWIVSLLNYSFSLFSKLK